MARKKKSSSAWLREHEADPYTKKSRHQETRARSHYKLAEIDDRDRFLAKGQVIVDLGAAPGGWSIEAKRRVGDVGRVVAVDLLEIKEIPGVEILQGDFTSADIQRSLVEKLPHGRADVVISDMAPNISGIRSRDQALAMGLAEEALLFAEQVLAEGGVLLIKIFQGEGVEAFRRSLEQRFQKIAVRKPAASRDRSREFYLLATGFKCGI